MDISRSPSIPPKATGHAIKGLVALEGQSLEEAAHHYFTQSEQIPTRVRLAAGELYVPGANGSDGGHGAGPSWAAGGLLVQFLPKASERRKPRDLPGGDAPPSYAEAPPAKEDDAWTEARMLTDTIEDHELIDPMLSAERLLVRLFHERGVRAFEPTMLKEAANARAGASFPCCAASAMRTGAR